MKKRILRYQEHKHPLSRLPTEHQERMKRILHDREALSVYCDYSSILNHPIMGVGICIVGYSSTQIKSRKYYTDFANMTVYGEVKAVTFALMMLLKEMEKYNKWLDRPSKVIVYTDCSLFANEEVIQSSKPYMADALDEYYQYKQQLEEAYKWLTVTVKFLGEEKKHNMYYKAAHNASRKVISK